MESGVDSTDGRICVRQSPKEGLEVRSFHIVERPSDLDATVSVTQKPAGVFGDEDAKAVSSILSACMLFRQPY